MSASEADSRPALGDVVRGTYAVEELLGVGTFGSVYKVRHRFLGIQAMKVFRVNEGGPSVEAVVEEARILSALLHPCIVRVFEANTLDDTSAQQPYMTMEFVPGGTLDAFLERKVRLSPLSALKTAEQICAGLAAAHSSSPPIVHRDVKPSNVLVSSVSLNGTPQIKIADFGLAKHVDPTSLMTRAAGTLHYLAPEAAWGYHSPSSDVYSTGVVLYQMLTGTFPFAIPSDQDVSTLAGARDAVLQSRRELPPPPSRFRMGLAWSIEAVVLRALAPEANDRYPHAMAFADDLGRLVANVA